MRAVTWHGRADVRVDTVPDPVIATIMTCGCANAPVESPARAMMVADEEVAAATRRLTELDRLLALAARMGVAPRVGVRVKSA